ncbi:hypothetical protein JCM8547_000262 [Rhodosporidiobolus lusitaniae]
MDGDRTISPSAPTADGGESSPSVAHPSLSPPRLPSAKNIARWPSSILLDIFLLAGDASKSDSSAWLEQRAEDVVGGALARWRSNVVFKPLASVCRGWRDAATTVLYRSISISSPASAAALLRTLTDSPSLLGKIKRLSIGIVDPRLVQRHTADELLECSENMVRILQLCHNLVALQINPLHYSHDDDVVEVLKGLRLNLETLVLGPRHYRPADGPLLRPLPGKNIETIVRGLMALRTLELNVGTSTQGDAAVWGEDVEEKRPIKLKQLGIYAELDNEVLEGLLSECQELEVLDIYAERDIRTKEVRDALKLSLGTMKTMRIVINPTSLHNGTVVRAHGSSTPIPILFDPTLLPFYRVLERLHTCHNLVSPDLFRYLPVSHSLRHLSLHALAPATPSADHFRFTPSLLTDLQDPKVTPAVDALTMVRIRDVISEWGEEHVKAVRGAFENRGVSFRWEEDGDSSQGSQSPSVSTGPGSDPPSGRVNGAVPLPRRTSTSSAERSLDAE